jgi:hypothetical protein
MTQILLNIPDSDLEFFMKLIEKYNYKMTQYPDSAITEEDKKLVDYRSKTASAADYLTVNESNERLKKKYGF